MTPHGVLFLAFPVAALPCSRLLLALIIWCKLVIECLWRSTRVCFTFLAGSFHIPRVEQRLFSLFIDVAATHIMMVWYFTCRLTDLTILSSASRHSANSAYWAVGVQLGCTTKIVCAEQSMAQWFWPCLHTCCDLPKTTRTHPRLGRWHLCLFSRNRWGTSPKRYGRPSAMKLGTAWDSRECYLHRF